MTLNEFNILTFPCWKERYQPLPIDMKKDKYAGRYRLGLNHLSIPDTNTLQNY